LFSCGLGTFAAVLMMFPGQKSMFIMEGENSCFISQVLVFLWCSVWDVTIETLCVSLFVASLHQKVCGVMHLRNKNW